MSKKLEELLATQQRLAEFGAIHSKLVESISAINQIHLQPILDIQRQIVAPVLSQYEMATQMQAYFNSSIAPIQEMIKAWSNALSSSLHEMSINSDLQRQIKLMQESLSSLTPALEMVAVHKNYVSVPESLIPDDFSYEEIAGDSADNSDEVTKTAVPVKRLSFADTLAIITLLIDILFFTITFIQTSQDSLQEQKNHDEQVAIETEANKIQEERNRILQKQVEAIEKQTEYLMAIYNKVEEAGSAFQESDSTFLDTDSVPLSPASLSQCTGSGHPIEADDPDDSDVLHKAD